MKYQAKEIREAGHIKYVELENKLLKDRICLHARELGGYLGDGIASDSQALEAFINYHDPDSW